MEQEHQAHQRDDQALLDQGRAQRLDRTHDEIGAIVDRLHADPLGQAAGQLHDLVLDPCDHRQRVLAVARDDDPGDHIALAVEIGNAAALVRYEFDPGNIADQHRCAAFGAQHQALDVLDATQVATSAHHVLGLGHFDHAAADVTVARRDHLGHPRNRDVELAQPDRIDGNRVLAHEAADAGDLRHAGRGGELVAQVPVLHRAQFVQRMAVALEHVLVDPAHARGVGAKRRRYAGWQVFRRDVQVLEHARARPVDVRAFLEDDVDEGGAEEREAADVLRFRHREQGAGQRVGHLVLDHLGRLPRILGEHDHLHVRQVRLCVQRRLQQRVDATGDDGQHHHQHQEDVADRPFDKAAKHVSAPRAG